MNDYTRDVTVARQYFSNNPDKVKLSHKQPSAGFDTNNSVLKVNVVSPSKYSNPHKLLVMPKTRKIIGAGGNGYAFVGYLYSMSEAALQQHQQVTVKIKGDISRNAPAEYKLYSMSQEEFIKSVSLQTLKLINSQLINSNPAKDISKEIFSKIDTDTLLDTFTKNKQPCIQQTADKMLEAACSKVGLLQASISRKANNQKEWKHYCQAWENYGAQERELADFKAVRNNNKHYIITDYIDGIDLHDIMTNMPSKLERHDIAVKLLKELDEKYHKNNTIHSDLKLENILYDIKTKKLRIIDLDYANIMPENAKEDDFIVKTLRRQNKSDYELATNGTFTTIFPWSEYSQSYTAPEAFLGIYSKKSDIYSLGVIFKHFFQMRSDLIELMLCHDPIMRPTLQEVKEHIENVKYSTCHLEETEFYRTYHRYEQVIANAPSPDIFQGQSSSESSKESAEDIQDQRHLPPKKRKSSRFFCWGKG